MLLAHVMTVDRQMNTFMLLKFSNSAWRADNKEGKTFKDVRATTTNILNLWKIEKKNKVKGHAGEQALHAYVDLTLSQCTARFRDCIFLISVYVGIGVIVDCMVE